MAQYDLKISSNSYCNIALALLRHAERVATDCTPAYAYEVVGEVKLALQEIGWNTKKVDELLASLEKKLESY